MDSVRLKKCEVEVRSRMNGRLSKKSCNNMDTGDRRDRRVRAKKGMFLKDRRITKNRSVMETIRETASNYGGTITGHLDLQEHLAGLLSELEDMDLENIIAAFYEFTRSIQRTPSTRLKRRNDLRESLQLWSSVNGTI